MRQKTDAENYEGRAGQLIRGQMSLGPDFAIKKRSVQLLHELYQLLWILFAACCFGKYTPISNLGFHWFTSVALRSAFTSCMCHAKNGSPFVLCGLHQAHLGKATFNRVINSCLRPGHSRLYLRPKNRILAVNALVSKLLKVRN